MNNNYKIIETIREKWPHLWLTIKYTKDLDDVLDQLDSMMELETICQDLRIVISDLKRHLGHKIYMIYARQEDKNKYPDPKDDEDDEQDDEDDEQCE